MENYSVLLPVYNREKPEYLRKSIQSMIDQTVPTDDFVVVCDGPLTEKLDAVLSAYESLFPDIFRLVRLEENRGLGAALNEGMKYCRNKLIARMDSDD